MNTQEHIKSFRKKAEELELIATGDKDKIRQAIQDHAFNPATQITLLEPENKEILDLYLSIRKPCREFVKTVLEGDYNEELVKSSVVGNSLSKENEMLLVGRYPDMVEAYQENNPNGPYLCDEAYEKAQENQEIAGIAKKFEIKSASLNMGSMFSPEVLKKLGIKENQ